MLESVSRLTRDLTTAAVSHLAAATAPEALRMVSFMNDWTREHVAGHEPRSVVTAIAAALKSGNSAAAAQA